MVESRSEQGQAAPRSHLWLLSRRVFQAPFDKSADLDKVSSAIAFPVTFTPDDKGYRQPAKANTTFPFRFLVPLDAASAVECGQEVRTRYTLTGYAKVRISGSFETIANSLEVVVSRTLRLTLCRWMLWNSYPTTIYIEAPITNMRL